MSERMERQPDFDSTCKRYGHVDMGGELYRVPRMSLGPYGDKLRKAVDAVKDKDGEDMVEAFKLLFHLAMSRFYNEDTVGDLLESGNVGFEQIGEMIAVISGIDTEKKSSADVS